MSLLAWWALVSGGLMWWASWRCTRAAKQYEEAARQYVKLGHESWDEAMAAWTWAVEEGRRLDERRADFPGDEWKRGAS